MKVTIDEDRCRGHGICCAACPEVFEINDDGYSVVTAPDVPTGYENAVRSAADSCPERAITLS